jgi:hypothetical protein
MLRGRREEREHNSQRRLSATRLGLRRYARARGFLCVGPSCREEPGIVAAITGFAA